MIRDIWSTWCYKFFNWFVKFFFLIVNQILQIICALIAL